MALSSYRSRACVIHY